ncbi:EAL domain-containing protein [Vibrio aquaticus]|uniref:EAL domain-containing protein n=2 Tax=Vibrio aquaticus TaxID=2496559 RepID=A0A3S0V5E4_9VIBR|nr:EAL domain-containing protein [Vibrio aquaticus]
MATLNDKKLVFLIRFAPSMIVALFATLTTIAVITDSREKARLSSEALYSNISDHQKQVIAARVEQIFTQANIQQSKSEDNLKQQASERVAEAHRIATNIYANNQSKSEREITKMISDALRPIRFFNGRGYFFIYEFDGMNVMHPLKPHIEGTSAWEVVDKHGTLILQEHIKRIEQQGGEAFYSWWYQKPGYPLEQEFEKVGYGKKFEPYNWLIGTGEYTSNVEEDVKATVLEWVTNTQAGKRDNVFILDESGTFLYHDQPELIGMRVGQITPMLADDEVKYDNISAQGNFVTFDLPKSSLLIPNYQGVAYMRAFDSWKWVIGSTFSVDEINSYIHDQKQELDLQNRQHLSYLILLSILSIMVMTGLSYLASQFIVKRFDKFQQKIARDFTRLEQRKNQMQHMALHDPLTGLSNRTRLSDSITEGIEQSKNNGKSLAVAFLDLDDFKKVNDLYGHATGDELLKSLSRRFEAILGKHDSVARFGGDEFVFCLPLLSNLHEATQKINDIKAALDAPFLIEGRPMTLGSSLGVSLYPKDSCDPEILITNADIMLYRAKQQDKGSALFFNQEINHQIKNEYRIDQLLRGALQREEMSVVYQPQISAQSQQIEGVEALVRWSNEELGFVGPDVFIPLAEENGLIGNIGRFVLKKACKDVYQISPNGPNALKLSVNVSPKELLADDVVDTILETVMDVGIDAKRITLEVTESIFVDDMQRVIPILERLQALGFCISLDDFGTGYSSLSHLNNLTINELKIDRSFITNMVNNAQSNALVKAILAISQSYQLQVVAEGVETKEQYLTLKSYGCQSIQGYYFAKPMTPKALSEWMKRSEPVEA